MQQMLKRSNSKAGAGTALSSESFKVICPKCKTEIPLTETLAQPLIEAEREKVQEELRARGLTVAKREQELAQRLQSLDRLEANLNARATEIEVVVEQTIRKEREALTKGAERKAAELYVERLKAAERELVDNHAKLAAAEAAELAVRKERRVLQDEKRRLELEIERRLHDERLKIREAAQKEEQEAHHLKLSEKNLLIGDLRKQIDDLRRKVDQGSVQVQGEVQELELEALLRAAFPGDQIEPVPQGRAGGDVVHKVVGPSGLQCGTILWESKRTRNWNDDWLAKNREDQRLVGSHVGVIVTATMPPGVDNFDRVDGVWVAAMRCLLPLAKALRLSLVEMSLIKSAAQGKDGKMQRMYGYLTGMQFRVRVASMVESVIGMQEDLDAERRAMTRKWAKQQRRIEIIMTELASTWGDLQGIVGKGMAELEGLALFQLNGTGPEPSKAPSGNGAKSRD
jgi:hypothetical protein